MYYEVFNLLNNLIFNGSAVSGTFESQALTFLSLALVCGMIYMPFKLVLGFVGFITDWRR